MPLHSPVLIYMNYTQALQYIEYINTLKGSVLGLDSIRTLCDELNNPQDDLKFVHIAGTNGKGSTLAFTSTILTESGYRVGRYISPTIREYRERFQINGSMISQNLFTQLLEEVKNACDRMCEKGYEHPTAFEIETALAFLYFERKKCDIVVLETGMGGTDDATNIVKTTVLSILASISMDHMQFLGDTLDKITLKKCGIIKPSVPVVSAKQKEESEIVIKQVCVKNASPLTIIDKTDLSNIKYGLTKQSFKYKGNRYEIKLAGTWQPDNAILAIEAANILKENGFSKISEESIQKGLIKTEWQARFQVLKKKPLFIIDGAHNEDAAIRLRESIDRYLSDKNKIYIMGMFRDKEVDKVVSTIVKDGLMVFTCQTPNNARALRSVELADIVKKYNNRVTCCDSVDEAVEFATSMCDENSAIIACGSLAYLGRILDIYQS